MDKLISNNSTYSYYEYVLEADFERNIVAFASQIFGSKTVYIDIKKRIGDSIMTIPDGYLIDFTFASKPRLYIIENELSSHDPYKHIGSQLLKFAISYKASGRKIKDFLLQYIMNNPAALAILESSIAQSQFRNIDNLLEYVIYEQPVAAIIVIDKLTDELNEVLSQLTMVTEPLEFQTFTNGSESIHKFTPFNDDLRVINETPSANLDIEDLDTLIVAAKEEGFEREFLGNNCWYAVRIHASMLDRIKYIAAYQVAPVSAITHYAEVSSIDKYQDTNKYILRFKSAPSSIKPISLDKDPDKKGMAPQGPRYTSLSRLLKASKISEVY
jgi:hypothetical protein